MAEPAAHIHHAIDYIELTVADVAASKRFYAAAFGWTFNDYGPGYAGIVGDGKEMGGLAQGQPRGGGGPLVVLYSADLEATFAAAKEAGATITKDIFEFPGGRRFELTDPDGYDLGVWGS